MDRAQLRDRLRRAGVQPRQPRAPQTPPAPVRSEAASIESLVPGREVKNRWGAFYFVEDLFEPEHRHGGHALGEFLTVAPEVAAQVSGVEALARIEPEKAAFIDIETTGLGVGAGTLAFLVGVGSFEAGLFHLRQYFLRQPGEEQAMLMALYEDVGPRPGFISFNGRAFDMRVLDSRFVQLYRRRIVNLPAQPNFDLLHPARRLWKSRLPSCTLGELEASILGVERTQADVPGGDIPVMYQTYLASGDAHDMARVIYHNAMDVLSMVVLAAHMLDLHARPVAEVESPEDHLALALWHCAHGRLAQAEASFRSALRGPLAPDERRKALARYAAMLKRLDRRAEAVPLWEQLFTLRPDAIDACVEIAKYYEWQASDYARATEWTRAAMASLERWPADWQRTLALEGLERRLRRLEKKASVL